MNKIYRLDTYTLYTLPQAIVDKLGGLRRNIRAVQTHGIAEIRKPLKGEFYISGAIPEAYQALNDLDREYEVVQLAQIITVERVVKLLRFAD